MKIKIGEAIKFDKEKPKMALLPPKALRGIAEAFTHGEKDKYHAYNYKSGKGLDWDQPFSATLRHMEQFWDGEDVDKDSKIHHLKCAGAGIMMLIDLVESNIGKDTRFKL